MQSLSPSQACQFDVNGDLFVCRHCGLKVPTRLFKTGKPFVACASALRDSLHAAKAIRESQLHSQQPRGLGDRLSDALSSVGITKERASAVASAVGVKDCGCGRRQKWVNKMGKRYFGMDYVEGGGVGGDAQAQKD